MENNHKPILSIRVEPDLLEWIDNLCQRTGVGRAEIVERCLYAGLTNEEQLVQWLESPVRGTIANLVMHPTVLQFLGVKIAEIDQTQQKMRKHIASKRRTVRTLKPRTA